MKQFKLNLPNHMADFLEKKKIDDITEFKRAAFMLYAYIDAGILSHARAAKFLGIEEDELIGFYGEYGIPYINYGPEAFAESEKKLNDYYTKKRTKIYEQ